MDFTFRDSTDAEELYAIAKAAYKGSPWSKKVFQNDLKGKFTKYLLIEADSETVGFVGGTHLGDELEITNVAVMPGFQGQHLGERLLREWFGRFEDGTRVLLEVRHRNKRAIRLYERLGFIIYNIREDYYRDPVEDAYLMDVTLPLRGEGE